MAARTYPLAAGAVFHSDRGSNYTSREFGRTLKKYNLRQSVGRAGICYDMQWHNAIELSGWMEQPDCRGRFV